MITDEKMNIRKLQLVWTLAFSLNLIVPMILGWRTCQGMAKVGLILALVVDWLAGIYVCRKWKRIGQSLAAGGFLVALTQVFPVLQIMAGLAACSAWQMLDRSIAPLNSMIGGFFMTWVTGGLLIGVALVVGMFIVFVFHTPEKAKPAVSEFDRAWPVEP